MGTFESRSPEFPSGRSFAGSDDNTFNYTERGIAFSTIIEAQVFGVLVFAMKNSMKRLLSHFAAFYGSTGNSRLLPQGLRHIRLDGNCLGQVRIARIRRVCTSN